MNVSSTFVASVGLNHMTFGSDVDVTNTDVSTYLLPTTNTPTYSLPTADVGTYLLQTTTYNYLLATDYHT